MKPIYKKAFDGLIPGKPINEYDASQPSAFDKLKNLLGISKTKSPNIISPEDMIRNSQSLKQLVFEIVSL